MPVVKPAGDSKPGWWIARELGIRLGLEEYFPWKNIEEVLDWQFKQVGTSLEEMKKIGIKDFDKEDYLYIPEGAEWEFNTPSGKIELFSNTLAAEGYPGLPNYTEHKQNPQGFYRLIYGRVPMHTFGRTVNNPYLSTLRSENRLWINPKVAKDWGIEDGQEVWLENQDGVVSSFSVKVRITERINSRAVYLPHGFGSTGKKLSRAYGKGVSDSEMITNVKIDPETGATGMRENFVTLLLEKPEKEAKPV
jgi:thiosulfate reductase/polysulfide reductase chain A